MIVVGIKVEKSRTVKILNSSTGTAKTWMILVYEETKMHV